MRILIQRTAGSFRLANMAVLGFKRQPCDFLRYHSHVKVALPVEGCPRRCFHSAPGSG